VERGGAQHHIEAALQDRLRAVGEQHLGAGAVGRQRAPGTLDGAQVSIQGRHPATPARRRQRQQARPTTQIEDGLAGVHLHRPDERRRAVVQPVPGKGTRATEQRPRHALEGDFQTLEAFPDFGSLPRLWKPSQTSKVWGCVLAASAT
jgi:hypothetical protein